MIIIILTISVAPFRRLDYYEKKGIVRLNWIEIIEAVSECEVNVPPIR